MLRLYIPAGIALVAIIALTGWEASLSDRFTSSSMTAAEFGKRFKDVPMKIGDWEGKDMTPEKATLEQAGAVSHVSRRYVHQQTRQQVDLWLIVGHAREICRHTPDICYPSQGYTQIGTRIKHKMETPDEPGRPATFFTAKFRNESALGTKTERVFWTWNGNDPPDRQDWEAPDFQKLHYGNNTALYKMYFTASMVDDDEPVARNVANEFGKLMLPKINRALFPERYKDEAPASDAEATPAADATPEPAASDAEAAPATDASEPAATESPAVEAPPVAG